MKITYWIKAGFLFLSWIILFSGLEGDSVDEKIFFTSVLIYTGAIVFDLIFLCIETYAEANNTTEGIYKSSIILTVVNSLLCICEFIGSMEGFYIAINTKKELIMKIVPCGLTQVFPKLLGVELKMSWFMIFVLIVGMCSIIPGLLLTKNREKNQEDNQS